MTFEECLELVMAYGDIREEIGKQTDLMQRNKTIVDASEKMADFIAGMMTVRMVDKIRMADKSNVI